MIRKYTGLTQESIRLLPDQAKQRQQEERNGMNLKDISTYFDGVTRFNDNSFQCKCPVHNDHNGQV